MGTQQNWSPQSDFTPFTTTRCYLKHRKESIHFNVFPQSIAKQFAFKGCNKCLFKIQYECVNLSSIVQHFSPIIYYRSQLSLSVFFLFVARQPGFNCWFSFAPVYPWCCSTPQGSPGVGRNTLFMSSPHLCFIIVFIPSSIVQNFSPIIYYRSQLSRNFFLSVAGPTGFQLLVFLCSSVPVLLFDTPGISRCRSPHFVSVKSSSLFHHSIYP